METVDGETVLGVEIRSVDEGMDISRDDTEVKDEASVDVNVRNGDGFGNEGLEIDADVHNCIEFEHFVGLDPYLSVLGDTKTKSSSAASEKPKYGANDLVWGKVRSHPWWPGQILDPSAASEKAKKHFKKGSYLIAYFGDHTFAWNEPSRIKPFRHHFSQMEKQSSMVEFQDAIDCALEEVSRRVELGLACSCISKEAYDKVKAQTVVNAGIREESCGIEGGDSFSGAALFEPSELVHYVKSLACSARNGLADRLKFVTLRAQLLAFHRRKGYPELPQFETLHGSLETKQEVSLSEQVKKNYHEVTDSVAEPKVGKLVSSGKSKSTDEDGTCHKRKKSFTDDDALIKREKTLSEMIAERRLKNDRNGAKDKSGGKSIPSSNEKKRKLEDWVPDDSAVKVRKSNLKNGDGISEDSVLNYGKDDVPTGNDYKSPAAKPVFRVGASILKVASQLNGSNPSILKPCAGASPKTTVKGKSKEKPLSGKSQSEDLSQSEISSLDEMLSLLVLAAKNPIGNHSSLISLMSFFVDFRNSFTLGNPVLAEFERSLGQASSGNIQENQGNSEKPEAFKSDDMKDPSEKQKSLEYQKEESLPEIPIEKDIRITSQQTTDSESLHKLHDEDQPGDENLALEAMQPISDSDQERKEDTSPPTALILNFTDLSSVPSEENLNKIFSRYGPLKESETEVLKKSKRAKVVFKRSEDAETAFSSAGKYGIFGPSLLSYRLKYMPSTPSKAQPQSQKDVDSTNRNAS